MQYKMLNFYRLLANFATSLIGAFVPMIVYMYTKNLFIAFLPIIAQNFLVVVFNMLFKKLLHKYPQIFLLLRIIPLFLYQIFIILLNSNTILGIVGISVFSAISYCFKNIPGEIVFNYATSKNQQTTKALGISNVMSQAGYVLAGVLGGVVLDHVSSTVLVIISMSLYCIASIPLFIFYIKNRKQKYFNHENISNAYLYLEHQDTTNKGKKLVKKFKLRYAIVYFLICMIDSGYYLLSMYTYIHSGTFALAGIMTGLFDAMYGIGSYVVSKLDEKIDLTPYATFACILIGILYGIMPLLGNILAMYIIFVFIGLIYPITTIFLHGRMLSKSQILGISNDCQGIRQNMAVVSPPIIFCFSPLGFIVMFATMGILGSAGGVAMYFNEEKTRKEIVNYLQQNDN